MTKKKKYAAAAIAAAGAVILLAVLLWHRQPPVPYLIHEGDTGKVRKMQGERGETLSIGASQLPASIHPYQGLNETMEILKKLVYEPLAYENRDGSLTYALAESIVISADGKSARVVLEQGNTFGDGQEVTARDVAEAYGWHQDAANGSAYQAVLDRVASAEANGMDTLRLEFVDNTIENLEVFTVPVMHVTEEILRKNETMTGSGPYELTALVPSSAVRLTRREGMSPKAYPYGKIEIESPAGVDFTEMLGEQSYDWLYLSDVQMEAVCQDGAYNVYEFGKKYGKYLVLNKNHPGMAQADSRRQIAAAIDREQLFEDCFEDGRLPGGLLLGGSHKEERKGGVATGKTEGLTLFRELDGPSMAVADWVAAALEEQGIPVEQRDKMGEAPLSGEDVAMYLYNGWYTELIAEDVPFTIDKETELQEYCKSWENWIWEEKWILPLWQEGYYGASLAGREIPELIQ